MWALMLALPPRPNCAHARLDRKMAAIASDAAARSLMSAVYAEGDCLEQCAATGGRRADETDRVCMSGCLSRSSGRSADPGSGGYGPGGASGSIPEGGPAGSARPYGRRDDR